MRLVNKKIIMNREIKFRVWNQKEMLYLNSEQFITFGDSGFFSIEDHSNENFDKSESFNGHKDLSIMNSLEDDLVLMQYTGLKDKKGKEIYEGDIWKERISTINGFIEVIFTIVYDDEYAAFAVMVDSNEEDTREINRPWANEVEIVGNIYETPHLLNSEQSVKESDTTKAT